MSQKLTFCKNVLSLLFFLFTTQIIFSQNNSHLIKGKILESKSKQPIPGATIRILNTTKGTISDENGNYLLNLEQGKYEVQISNIGYNSETYTIDLNKNIERNIELKESFVQMSEVLIVAEDPGIGIIRRAIANKRKWMDKLKSYNFTAYTKNTLFKEDSVASITESYSNGYWRKDDGYRERVFQKRQTENIKLNQNFAQVGGIINFNEDEIKIAGYTFTGPTSPDALNDYTFKLLKTYQSRGYNIYELQVIPTSRFKPLFQGIISISDSIYAIAKVEVVPNDVFKIPFIKDFNIRFTSRFNVFDTIYWMPTDIAIDLKATIKIPGLKMPAIGMKQRSIIYDYEINKAIPDTIFGKRRVVSDSTTQKFDSTFWERNKVLPLSAREEVIYKTLDSTKTLDKQFKPEGPLTAIGDGAGGLFKPLEYVDFDFNRVHGWYFGGTYSFDTLISKQTRLNLKAGYGFSDKKWSWEIGLRQRFKNFMNTSISLKYFNKLEKRPDEDFYPGLINTLTSIIDKNDYNNYYYAKGFGLNLHLSPFDWLGTGLRYLYEKEELAKNEAGHGFFSSKSFRPNPSINPGNMGSITVGIDIYKRLFENENAFIRVQIGEEEPAIRLTIENASKALGSDFNYTKYVISANYVFPTFLRSLFLPPYLSFKLRGGFSTGNLPIQRIFDLESASTHFSPTGTFKTMNVKEYSGTEFLEAHIEHNFRSLPFRMLKLNFIEEEGIEFITFGSFGKTKVKEENLLSPNSFLNTTDNWYSEAGFGFSKILMFLRVDFSWRLTNRYGKLFFVTMQIGNIL